MKKVMIALFLMLTCYTTAYANGSKQLAIYQCTNTATSEVIKVIVFPDKEDINSWAANRYGTPYTCTKK